MASPSLRSSIAVRADRAGSAAWAASASNRSSAAATSTAGSHGFTWARPARALLS